MHISTTDLAHLVPIINAKGKKTLLHVGCGMAPKSRLPQCFQSPDWVEVRLDIDEAVNPDVISSIVKMPAIDTASVDAVWSSHSIEHIEKFEVPSAFKEMHRVLRPGGFALITTPDLEKILRLILAERGDDTLYTSPAGPITPFDMLFGHQKSIEKGNRHMAHRTGFTATTLQRLLIKAQFDEVRVTTGTGYDLWALAVKRGP